MVSEEFSWLFYSPGFKVLREGHDQADFAIRLKEIYEDDIERSNKLHDICERLLFIEQLRHTIELLVTQENQYRTIHNIDRLITYLTLTCVDVAANKTWKPFDHWLNHNLKTHNPPESIKILTTSILNQEDQSRLKVQLRKTIGPVFNDYLDEVGISRNFKKFWFSSKKCG